ncbi:hypothetical protein IWW37_002144 [Coemansia sp. RSA 2050]|nr:hypothetical protein IWW37_002144 [Coemansia sp. RSA 2050]
MAFWRRLSLLQLLLISALAGSLRQSVGDTALYQDSGAVVAAPFDRISRLPIQNAPTLHNSTVRSAVGPATQTGSNEQCHRAIQRHSHSCQYIRKHCAGYGDGIVSYVELYYCTYRARHGTVLVLMAAWLALLFVWLGVSASEYFSPNVSTLSQLMRLPESLAGVTLLALGNGAPDLFSTFSAVRAGSGALALGQLIGSASFIVSVVIGATTLVVPVYKVSQLSYLRELCFFVATVGMVSVIVLSERLSRGLAICMMALYVAYVITVMVTTYYEGQYVALEASVGGLGSVASAQADQPSEVVWSGSSSQVVQPDSGGQREDSQLRSSHGQTIVDHHRHLRAGRSIDLGHGGSLDQRSPDNQHGNGVSVRALGEFLNHHPKSLLAAAECSDIIDEMRLSQSYQAEPVPDEFTRPLRTTVSSSIVDNGLCHGASRLASLEIASYSKQPNTGGVSELPSIWLPWRSWEIDPHIPEQISVERTPGVDLEFSLALDIDGELRRTESGTVSALPVLLLSATVPVLACLPEHKEDVSALLGPSIGEDDSASSLCLPSPIHRSAIAESGDHFDSARLDSQHNLAIAKIPAERTSLSRQSSSSHLHMVMEGLTYDRSVQALNVATATWAEGAVSGARAVMSVVFLYSVLSFSALSTFAASVNVRLSLGLVLAVLSLLGNHLSRHRLQHNYWLQVVPCLFGFACGLAWVYTIANEVVSITQALGLILGLSEEILGLTVVGFGNSLGDLVTNLALTRMGYPMMALSACFGGPMLCLLIGVGVAAYGIMAGSGPDNDDAYHMPITSPTVLVSTACLLLNSLIFLVAIPRQGYHMTRAVGLAVLAVYFTGMAANVYLEW